MARKSVLVDDIDQSEAAETVRFSVDGQRYEVDLNEGHAAELRGFLERFIAAGRPAGSGSDSRTRADRERGQAIRAWAREQGHDINESGRIPTQVMADFVAWEQRTGQTPAPGATPETNGQASKPARRAGGRSRKTVGSSLTRKTSTR